MKTEQTDRGGWGGNTELQNPHDLHARARKGSWTQKPLTRKTVPNIAKKKNTAVIHHNQHNTM